MTAALGPGRVPGGDDPRNVHSTQQRSFDPSAIELARTFAAYAAVAIAYLYQATLTLADDMRRAMETRAVIEQAKGVVIAQQHCTRNRPSTGSRGFHSPSTARPRDCATDIVATAAKIP